MHYPWNLIGHEKLLLRLEKELSEGKLAHAYLFEGPSETGKFTLASLFAKILICENQLCHQCQDCQQMEAGTHPDFIVMKDDGESLKIDAVRALINKTNMTSQGKKRVVLIEHIERMPTEAQNAFLKTLEEPSGKTIFILTSRQPKAIVPTILSRVRTYGLQVVPDEVIQKALIEKGVDPSGCQEILQLAQGKPGLAIKLAVEPMLKNRYRELFYKLEGFLKQNDLVSKFAFVEELDKDPEQLELFFEVMALVLKKNVHNTSPEAKKTDHLKKTYQLFEKFLQTRYLISRNINKKLALENLLLQTES